jgi:CIC family chloride channel protein
MKAFKNLKYFSRWSILGILIGIISGFGAVGFFYLLQLSSAFLLGYIGGYSPLEAGGEINPFSFSSLSVISWRIPLILLIGGLISGIVVYKFAPEAEGHGTDAYISSFHNKNGEIRERVPLVKAVASSIVIGSGGSAGREGPIAQIGAGFGSWLIKRLKLSKSDRRIAIVSGAAGGIGAIFKAPLGGAIFAIEVLYKRDLEVKALLPSFISSIVSYSIFGSFFGFKSMFVTPDFTFNFNYLIFYALLGLLCAFFAILYIRFFYFTRNQLFQRLKISKYFKPAIGCVFVGLIGLLIPNILGPGYGVIQNTIDVKFTMTLLLILILGKIVATSFTIGSGGSGGVFAPSLVIGSTIGGFLALFLNSFLNIPENEMGTFAIVGMASFITAVANVPIASIIMVSEMTNTYSLLLHSMLACTVSYILTTKWSIYESQVRSQAYSPVHRGKYVIDLLENVTVGEIMKTNIISVNSDNTLKEISELIKSSGHSGFPVIEDNKLVGIIVYRDLFKVLPEKMQTSLVKDVMSKNLITIKPDQNLFDALDMIENYGIGRLPVVASEDPSKFIGFITKRDILRTRELKRLTLFKKDNEK